MRLTTANGTRFHTYVSGTQAAKHGILLIHDWRGLQDYNREWAERLAQFGYLAMVVDLYAGQTAEDAEVAGRLMRSVDQQVADEKLRAGLRHLKSITQRVATLGWSFGGRQAMRAALLEPDLVSAVVLYYSRLINDVATLKTLRAPVLAIFAERERSWPDNMVDFESAMAHADKVLEVHTYDAHHGFVDPANPHYDSFAAEAAWDVSIDFLSRHLG